jgi:hypothetical protein
MPTIGIDCEIILDGNGYFVKPATYTLKQPRIRKATTRADGGLAYVDLGPGKLVWGMVILCINELKQYDGSLSGLSGQQYRDSLRTSYTSSIGSTVEFIDPLSSATVAVHFDTYEEKVLNLHSQIITSATGGSAGVSYEVTITLQEA